MTAKIVVSVIYIMEYPSEGVIFLKMTIRQIVTGTSDKVFTK